MAKDKKEEKGGLLSLANVTDENVGDQIKNANKFSKDLVEEATAKAEEKERERQIREFNEISQKATYINIKAVLRTRRDRAAEKATSGLRKKSLELLQEVKDGKLTAKDYDEALNKAVEDANKSVEEANKEFSNLNAELRNKFESSWRWDWDDPYRQVRVEAPRG